MRQAVLLNVSDAITQYLLSTSSNLETLILNCEVGSNTVKVQALKDFQKCPNLRTLAVCDGPWECLDIFLRAVVEARVPVLRKLIVTPDTAEPDSDDDEAKETWIRIQEQVEVTR